MVGFYPSTRCVSLAAEMGMISITIPTLSHNQELWLEKNVGPRKFYIHNMFGGEGWRVFTDKDGKIRITFDDDKTATLFMLST